VYFQWCADIWEYKVLADLLFPVEPIVDQDDVGQDDASACEAGYSLRGLNSEQRPS
jgi:hypothetical protein